MAHLGRYPKGMAPIRPRLIWQDAFNIASVLFAFAIARAEDMMFFVIFTSVALEAVRCLEYGFTRK